MNKNYTTLELNKVLQRLAEACSGEGARERALTLAPADNLATARTLLQQTEDAFVLIARFGAPGFGAAKNYDNALARAEAGGLLNMGELLGIAQLLKSVRSVLEWRSRSAGINVSIDNIFSRLIANKYLEDKINGCIKNEEEMNDNASPELFDIRRKMAAQSAKIRERLDSMVRSATYQKYLQEPVVTQRSGRYVLPVKAEYRAQLPGLVHDSSSSGATVFVEPMAVVEANNEIKLLKNREADEIERILYELSAEAGSFADGIRRSSAAMEQLDLIFAKARLGYDMKATLPELNDEGIIELHAARHPLLARDSVVPVDIKLGGEYSTLVITGPNTGGKTVTLKAIGLFTLMAACGLLIPAAERSRVAFFDKVLADIGDEQSIEQSLSTFSSHIKNIIEIMKIANSSSLVLLDELCSGTDPIEGAALATSILERLRESGATIAATTHYAELKAYALDTVGVENGCCEFDVNTLAPTYRLLIGVPGRSNAFAISQRLGMNEAVIARAKGYVSSEDNRFERVVERLESTRRELEQQQTAAQQAVDAAREQELQAREHSQQLQQEYNRELERAREAARNIVDSARVEANRLIEELEQLRRSQKAELSEVRSAARRGFERLESAADDERDYKQEYVLPRPLQIGDEVLLEQSSRPAVVLTLPDGKNKITVQAGIMKIKVAVDSVRLCEDKKPKKQSSGGHRNVHSHSAEAAATRSASMEIDVRGLNVEEATMEIERFIDNAVINGQHSITIIHGKGTGALRTGLHQFLRRYSAVRTFRLGVFGEGEAGVTIVELK